MDKGYLLKALAKIVCNVATKFSHYCSFPRNEDRNLERTSGAFMLLTVQSLK